MIAPEHSAGAMLEDICHSFGIRVYSYQEAPEVLRGLGMEAAAAQSSALALYYHDTPVILFDQNKPTVQCLFAAAHELGHIILGHVSFRRGIHQRLTDSMEREADAFAVLLLAHTLRGLSCPAARRVKRPSEKRPKRSNLRRAALPCRMTRSDGKHHRKSRLYPDSDGPTLDFRIKGVEVDFT